MYFFKVSSVSPHCCVNSKSRRNFSDCCRHLCNSVCLWNSSTPMKREVNAFLLADSRGPHLCSARCPLFGFAAELLRETSHRQPLFWAPFYLSSSEIQQFNRFLNSFFDSCSTLSHFISSWCMGMTQRGDVSALCVQDNNGTLLHWFLYFSPMFPFSLYALFAWALMGVIVSSNNDFFLLLLGFFLQCV